MCRGGKIGPARWASPVHPELGSGWAIKLLARKKSDQIWPGPIWLGPVWPYPTRFDPVWPYTTRFGPPDFFFLPSKCYLARPARFLRRAGLLKFWPEKTGPILARPDFGPTHCWPDLARPALPDCYLYSCATHMGLDLTHSKPILLTT